MLSLSIISWQRTCIGILSKEDLPLIVTHFMRLNNATVNGFFKYNEPENTAFIARSAQPWLDSEASADI